MPFVSSAADPHTSLAIDVRFVDAVFHVNDYHDARRRHHIFRQRMDRRPHRLARHITELLIQLPHFLGAESCQRAVILHTDENVAASAVGHGNEFCGNTLRAFKTAFELPRAVFADGNGSFELRFCHHDVFCRPYCHVSHMAI